MPQPPHDGQQQSLLLTIGGAIGGVLALLSARIAALWNRRTALEVQEEQSKDASAVRLSARLAELEEKTENLSHLVNELEQKLGIQNVDIERMKWREERLTQVHAEEIARLQEDLSERDEAIQARDREIVTLREEIAKLRQQLADVEVIGVSERAPAPRLKDGAE